MLEMRPDCERCGKGLPADEGGAAICSFECTFCAQCAAEMDGVCPNCSGILSFRPTRVRALLAKFPASVVRSYTP